MTDDKKKKLTEEELGDVAGGFTNVPLNVVGNDPDKVGDQVEKDRDIDRRSTTPPEGTHGASS